MKCATCGTALLPGSEFCRFCGADVPLSAPVGVRLDGLRLLRDRLSHMRVPSMSPRWPAGLRAPAIPRPHGPARPVWSARSAWTAWFARSVSRRGVAVALGALLVLLLPLVLVNVLPRGASGASTRADATAAELAAARDALVTRDARIANLEGTIAMDAQARSAIQSALQRAEQEAATGREQRDDLKQQVTALEAKVRQVEAALQEQQAVGAQQQQELRTLSTCLNGTAVALAFGRTGRWSSADVALGAVAAACKASEPLLQR